MEATTEQLEIVAEVEKVLPKGPVSPYRIAEVATKVMGRQVRPQLVYSYCRSQSGLLKAAVQTESGWKVDRPTALQWICEYVERNRK